MSNTQENNSSLIRTVFEWVELLAFSVACVLIVLNCFVRYSPVDGISMNKTLEDKDILILSNLFYEPDVGDIIVFASDNSNGKLGTGYNKPYVKRVIATEGQHVVIDAAEKKIYVDGKVSECEKYAFYDPARSGYPWTDIDVIIPEGHVFVLGDNRYNSSDSRALGPIDTRDIIGRVVFRLLPFDSIGTVE
ncbi:MAG: signal peptidase I [Ruminococcaceae bacterium]|nr:signal peptidase I [Oscillospiraceae bacterium]